jgi:hypothetical protein
VTSNFGGSIGKAGFRHRIAAAALAAVGLAGACFGAFVAWVTYYEFCERNDDGTFHPNCPLGDPAPIMVAQLAIGIVALLVTVVLFGLVASNRSRAALGVLSVAFISWGTWAITNDLAVHAREGVEVSIPFAVVMGIAAVVSALAALLRSR